MRSQLPFSILSALLVLLISSGCNTAYREAMSRAEDAAIRGDFMTAAHAYRDACRASPDDEKACYRAPVFAQKATDQAIATARPACEAGDLDLCLPPLLATLDLMPGHPEVASMLEAASRLHAERCSRWKAEGSLATAAAGLACLQSRGAQLPVPSYQALLAERATQLASRLAGLAATAQGPDSAGSAAVLWSAAQCLSPGGEAGVRADQARQGFLARSAIPVAIRVDGRIRPHIAPNLSRLCESMAANLAPAARCVEPAPVTGQPAPLELRLDAIISDAVTNVSEQVRSLRYLSGTRQVPNPDYGVALDRFHAAESEFESVESAKAEKDKECKKSKRTHGASCVGCPEPPKDPSCEEAEKLAEQLEDRTEELDKARKHLKRTPETLTEEVYEDFVYSVLTHRWAAPYRFTLQSNSPAVVPSGPLAGELQFEDQEHVGFSPAGLNPDPLVIPTGNDFANAFIRNAAPSVFEAVQRDAMARGTARRAGCSALPEDWGTSWVQCWAEATLWENGREPQATEFLRLLAASAGAADSPQCR
jgi:hypothetical protein